MEDQRPEDGYFIMLPPLGWTGGALSDDARLTSV